MKKKMHEGVWRCPQNEDWTKLFDQKFTTQELREASDLADVLDSYGADKSMLSSFIREDMKLGHRLFMAMNLPTDELGVMVLREDDRRITHILKERIGEINRTEAGHPNIIIP